MIEKKEFEQRVFESVLKYLLYEKQEETAMRVAFAELVLERHLHLHCPVRSKKNGDRPGSPAECKNEVCARAIRLLESTRKPEVEMNALSVDLMKKYRVDFAIDGSGFRAWLKEMSEIVAPKSKLII